jgi:hypothetical protein
MATQHSFDYSAFIYEGMIAGIAMAGKSEPSFRQRTSGYGSYYAHVFADGTIENYLVEAIVPTTREDSRYYTLGHGGLFKRCGCALSRPVVTRTDSRRSTLNFSEFVGPGAGAGIKPVDQKLSTLGKPDRPGRVGQPGERVLARYQPHHFPQ